MMTNHNLHEAMLINNSNHSLPLTQNQTAIWLDETLFPNSSMYHIGAYYEIKGDLKVSIFTDALQRVIAENDAFGIAIQTDDGSQPIQTFISQQAYQLPFYDFSNKENPKTTAIKWMENHFQKPFDISHPPLYDFVLIKAADNHYFWLMKIHHLIIDGWGYSVFTEKVAEEYNKALRIFPKKEKVLYPFKDYVQSELAYYGSEQFQKDKSYWLAKFETLPEPLRLAQDIEKAKEKLLPVSKHQWSIPRSLYTQIEAYAKAQKVSVFHFWLGILATYFHKTATQRTDNRLCIGVPVLNRSSRKFKDTIGLFTGMSPLLVAMEEKSTFPELLQQIKSTLRQDYRHQRFPIQELLRSVNHLTLGERDLFEIMFSYETQYLSLDLKGATEMC